METTWVFYPDKCSFHSAWSHVAWSGFVLMNLSPHLEDLSFYKTPWHQFKFSPSSLSNTLRKLDLLLQSIVKLVFILDWIFHTPRTQAVGMQFISLISKEWQKINLFDFLNPCGPRCILKQEKLRPGLCSYYDLRGNFSFSSGRKGKEGKK